MYSYLLKLIQQIFLWYSVSGHVYVRSWRVVQSDISISGKLSSVPDSSDMAWRHFQRRRLRVSRRSSCACINEIFFFKMYSSPIPFRSNCLPSLQASSCIIPDGTKSELEPHLTRISTVTRNHRQHVDPLDTTTTTLRSTKAADQQRRRIDHLIREPATIRSNQQTEARIRTLSRSDRQSSCHPSHIRSQLQQRP